MRVVSIFTVPLVAVGLSVTGIYLAPSSGAECEARNGTMLCTDPPPPDAPSAPQTSTSYPCVVDAWCDNFAFDVVVGDGPPDRPDPSPRPPRPPRPRPNN